MTATSRTLRNVLVAWFGIFQITHLSEHVFGEVEFVPKVIGFFQHGIEWSSEHDAFFHAMTFGDLIVSLLSVLFVVAYFLEKKWASVIGLIALTLTVYSGLIYDYGFVSSGAWHDHEAQFLYINCGFLPVVLLYGVLMFSEMRQRGRADRVNSESDSGSVIPRST